MTGSRAFTLGSSSRIINYTRRDIEESLFLEQQHFKAPSVDSHLIHTIQEEAILWSGEGEVLKHDKVQD